MKIANMGGRSVLVLDDGIADVESASGGAFPADPMAPFERWGEFAEFARSVGASTGALDESLLQCPVPRPRQVFAIGLNYQDHVDESTSEVPEYPATFTKFPASLAGPRDDIQIVADSVDWEVELVAVVGLQADNVKPEDAWSHLAGLTVGQDISDRELQIAAGRQFSLGKSRRGFGPMGPWVVSVDEFPDPDDLALGCSVDGETVQDARTKDLIHDVPQLVAHLSAVLTLLPGDIIFTGTPSGVGAARTPPRFLRPGNVLETWIEGIGTMRNRCV